MRRVDKTNIKWQHSVKKKEKITITWEALVSDECSPPNPKQDCRGRARLAPTFHETSHSLCYKNKHIRLHSNWAPSDALLPCPQAWQGLKKTGRVEGHLAHVDYVDVRAGCNPTPSRPSSTRRIETNQLGRTKGSSYT